MIDKATPTEQGAELPADDTLRIVIFGEHDAAMEVAGYLHAREFQVLIVDDSRDHLVRASDRGYQTAELDFRDDSELQSLALDTTGTTVFSLFDNDAENVFLIISIRALCPHTPIMTIAQDKAAIQRLKAAGAERVIDVHEISGRRIWDSLSNPVMSELLETTLFGKSPMNLYEVPVKAGSLLDQQMTTELTLDRDYDLIVIGLVDAQTGEQTVVTTAEFARCMTAGDTLLVIGHEADMQRFRARLEAP